MDKHHGWGRRRAYHHGNLKQALLEAARQLIEKHGPEGFTLTEAARLAGVSPAAPYRHFRDREALLAEVARAGFERFGARLQGAWADGGPTPFAAFERLGRAYLGFAREEPASYAAMFASGIAPAAAPGLQAAAEAAFAVLQRAAAVLAQRIPARQRPPAPLMSLHIWALAHGVASLHGDNMPARGKVPLDAEEVLESGMLIYLRGLGLIGGDGA